MEGDESDRAQLKALVEGADWANMGERAIDEGSELSRSRSPNAKTGKRSVD